MGQLQEVLWQALRHCPVFEGRGVLSNDMELRAWGMITPDYQLPEGFSEWEIRLFLTSCGEGVVCKIIRKLPHGVTTLCTVNNAEIKQIFPALYLELLSRSEV